MKAVVIIWLAVVVVVFGGIAYMDASIDDRVNARVGGTVVDTKELQPAATVYKLQPTTSDAFVQWGENPQRTIDGKHLQGSQRNYNLNLNLQ